MFAIGKVLDKLVEGVFFWKVVLVHYCVYVSLHRC
jgi:hypothetical protein